MRRKTVWFTTVLFFLLLIWILSPGSTHSGKHYPELLNRIGQEA